MSRLFEALQTYAAEVGQSFLDAASLPTDILKGSSDKAASVHADNLIAPEKCSTLSPDVEESGNRTECTLKNTPKVRTLPTEQLVSIRDERSLAAEKFRFLAVRLRYLNQRTGLKKVLVTSSISEEGKSFVAINLAVTLARKQRQRVLLIEGDLRRPSAAQSFGLPPMEGVCDWLADPEEGDRTVFLQEPKIWFLPAGSAPDNPLELMQSGRLPKLMGQMSDLFDWIIIDSPPILPLGDTTVWARVADGLLLVVREGKTQKAPLKRALECLGKANVLGVVLNSSSDTDRTNYYQGYDTGPKEK
jgi:capsular exopolysaccharide synthesis family protein